MAANSALLRKIALEKRSQNTPSIFESALAEKDKDAVDKAKMLPIFPNPGSQAHLMFDILGFKKGQSKKIAYPKESTEDAKRIIQKEGIIYPYSEVLEDEAIAYEVLPPEEFNPKAWTINVHCGNGIGKTSVMGVGTIVTMTKINPKGQGLISANTYPQLKNATIPAVNVDSPSFWIEFFWGEDFVGDRLIFQHL